MFASGWEILGSELKSKNIVMSLKNCGISNALDGIENDNLYEQIDASSVNKHDDHFKGSGEDFLGFYEE